MLKLNIKTKTSLVFMTLALLSCKNSAVDYDKKEGLTIYLQNVHHTTLEQIKTNVLYITPIEGCNDCILQNLYLLIRTPCRSITPIFIGTTTNEKILNLIKQVKKKYPTHYADKKSEIYKYQTGYNKPLFFSLKEGEISQFIMIEGNLIPKVEEILDDIN